MGILGHSEQFQRVVGVNPSFYHLLGNIIRTFGIHRHAIHLEIEGATDAVGLIDHLEGTDTRLELFGVQHPIVFFQHHLKVIQRLLAHLIRPPELRVFYKNRKHLMMTAFRQVQGLVGQGR